MSRFVTYTNTLALFGLNVMLCYEQSKSTKHWDNCLSHCKPNGWSSENDILHPKNLKRIKTKIQDHKEILELTVSNIGKKDVFIGHDWLMHHNPEMDWKNNQIKFSRCPGECYEESTVNEPEDEIDQFNSTTDKILAIAIDQPEYI
jgi:hypothetical protein